MRVAKYFIASNTKQLWTKLWILCVFKSIKLLKSCINLVTADNCIIQITSKQYGPEGPAEGAAYCNHMLINCAWFRPCCEHRLSLHCSVHVAPWREVASLYLTHLLRQVAEHVHFDTFWEKHWFSSSPNQTRLCPFFINCGVFPAN